MLKGVADTEAWGVARLIDGDGCMYDDDDVDTRDSLDGDDDVVYDDADNNNTNNNTNTNNTTTTTTNNNNNLSDDDYFCL